jgi:hypothetical protein
MSDYIGPLRNLLFPAISLTRTFPTFAFCPFLPMNLRLALPLLLTTALPLIAQELEPRRWSHLPMDTNLIGTGYAYTSADIAFNPLLEIKDATLDLHTIGLSYLRTFELMGKSARFDLTQVYQNGRWKGLLDGEPAQALRSGLRDPVLRLSVNLLGAPPLKGKDFAAYRAGAKRETIIGAGLSVSLPVGEYFDDKLINLGQNRYVFRPQLGIVHQHDKWSFELTGTTWLFTENDSFWNSNHVEQDPLYTLQGHVIYSIRPGLWTSASLGYAYGGISTVNGIEKNDRKENLAWALSVGCPITPHFAMKLAYIGTRTQTDTGADSDTIALGAVYVW